MARIKFTDSTLPKKGSSESSGEPTLWQPTHSILEKCAEVYSIPKSVKLSAVPVDADIYMGRNIPNDALILSLEHLRYVRFPIHPVFQLMWAVLGLHPFQLNPNSYLMLSAFLIMGLKWEVSLGLSDFLYLYNCSKLSKYFRYFNFTPFRKMKVFAGISIHDSDWKSRALMISGDWQSPELDLRPPKAFADDLAYKISQAKFDLSPSRVQWLETHLVERGWYPSQFATLENFLDTVSNRPSALFGPYQTRVNQCLLGKTLALQVARMEGHFYVSEHCEPLFTKYLAIKDTFKTVVPDSGVVIAGEDDADERSEERGEGFNGDDVGERLHSHVMRELPQIIPPPRKLRKQKAENAHDSNDPLHAPSIDLSHGAPPSSPSRGGSLSQRPALGEAADPALQRASSSQDDPTVFMPPSPPKALELKFKKRDGTYILAGESLSSNGLAASAVASAFVSSHPKLGGHPKSPMALCDDVCVSQLDALLASHCLLRGIDALHTKQQQKLDEVNCKLEFKEKELNDQMTMVELASVLKDKNYEITKQENDLTLVTRSKDEEF
ncbi:uncharacterized protein LOC133710290 [Rosa rugosa]|uniref:uncharacterized protein LOC133710290 n=1 Tax=Rosa rugosa TaxID=74645 RepID=UPI002B40178F|nr:uncharacterized protein LOC133710290 [Rosa rugosa]XP_061992311.1 uncharacterized protein LOC133710290 [Rosa rugosa]